MKRLMNKKANIFGKQVSVLVIALVAVLGVASAALVAYVSNPISGNVTVTSPVTLAVASGVAVDTVWTPSVAAEVPAVFTGTSITTISAIGGDSKNIWVYADNGASVPVEKNIVFTITNTEGLTKPEVEQIVKLDIYDWNNAVNPRVQTDTKKDVAVTADCGSSTTSCTVTLPIYLFANGLGDNFYANVKFNFPLNAHGTYDMSAQVMN